MKERKEKYKRKGKVTIKGKERGKQKIKKKLNGLENG